MLEIEDQTKIDFALVGDEELDDLEIGDIAPVDADLPNHAELQRLLSRLDDKLLAAFAREALPEVADALRENDLIKIQDLVGDWIATFEEYATPGAVDKIGGAVRNIEEGKGIAWEEAKELLKA